MSPVNVSSLVSVIIPTCNGQRWVAETLRAVLAQTHPSLEIIVVDDGSTDGTCEVVRQVAPRARLLTQANARVSAARNAGLAAAQGEFVIFLDQDDIWHPQQLARQVAWMQQHADCGAVVYAAITTGTRRTGKIRRRMRCGRPTPAWFRTPSSRVGSTTSSCLTAGP